jgi:hypothetical protein
LIGLAAIDPDWVLGFTGETRWSRRTLPREDSDPKAPGGHGLLRGDTGGMLLRFVQARPVSQVTEDFLDWTSEVLETEDKRAVAEPGWLLTAQEVKDRVCAYHGCEQSQPLEQKLA